MTRCSEDHNHYTFLHCHMSQCHFTLLIIQVREKALVNITAVNLNKMTLNFETVLKIKKGHYSFVYLVSFPFPRPICLTNSPSISFN
jgi:adenosine/AMP kinase